MKLTPDFDLHKPTSPPIRAIFPAPQVTKSHSSRHRFNPPCLLAVADVGASSSRVGLVRGMVWFYLWWLASCVERGSLILVLVGKRCSGPTRNISPAVLVVGHFPIGSPHSVSSPVYRGVRLLLGDLLLAGDDHVLHSPAFGRRHGYTVICRGKGGGEAHHHRLVSTLLRFHFIWGPRLLEALVSLVVSASQV